MIWRKRYQVACFCVLAVVAVGCGPTYRSNRMISKLQDKDPKVRDYAAEELVKIGAPAVEPLIGALNSPDGNLRTRVSDVLVKIGTPAVGPLTIALNNPDGRTRAGVSDVLAKIGVPAVGALVGTLKNLDGDVRKNASEALVKIGAPAVEPLVGAMNNPDGNMRTSASEALAKIGTPSIEPLLAALKNADENVRTGISETVVKIGPSAVESLIALLDSPNMNVRDIALKMLREINAPPPVKEELLTERQESLEVEPIASEGQIPADFSIAYAMKLVYGNFDSSTQSSVSVLPPGNYEHTCLDGVDEIEVRPLFTAQVKDSGRSKVFLVTYAGPLEGAFAGHACAPQMGTTVFVHTSVGWMIESATRTAIVDGEWGKPPIVHTRKIGPDRVAVEMEMAGFYSNDVILVPWKGEIGEAFSEIVGEGNGQVCSDEPWDGGDNAAPQPCVRTEKSISFVQGANPDYYDMVLTLSGTTLAEEKPYILLRPYKILQVSGSERRVFCDGKYVPSAR